MTNSAQYDAKTITQLLNGFGCKITLKEIKNPTVNFIL